MFVIVLLYSKILYKTEMKNLFYLISAIIILSSCEKTDDNNTVNLDFNDIILEEYDITNIAFDNLGNAWATTYNAYQPGDVNRPELIKYNITTQETTIWDSSNSLIKDSTYLWDITVDSRNNVWIACDGLIRFNGESFTRYDTGNSEIPVPFNRELAVDSNDNIWFSSSSAREGGLVKFDGTDFTVYTPENSPLPLNGVASIAIDKNDNIWLAQYRSLGTTNLVNISGDNWTVYTEQDLGFTPVYWGGLDINSKNQVFAGIDYTLSSDNHDPRPQLILFDGINCSQLRFNSISSIRSITVDHKDNIWCKASGNESEIAVYNGSDWIVDSLTFKDKTLETFELSSNNEIWAGTSSGIYINRQ